MIDIRELRDYNPDTVVVGQCRVCNMPVREVDEPTPIYEDPIDTEPTGFIHGAFDCMDAERCGEIRTGMHSSGDWGQHCELPVGHQDMEGAGFECLWSAPS